MQHQFYWLKGNEVEIRVCISLLYVTTVWISGSQQHQQSWAQLVGLIYVTWILSTTLLLPLLCFHLSSDAWPCRPLTSTDFPPSARSYRSPSRATAVFAETFVFPLLNPHFLSFPLYKCGWTPLDSLALLTYKTCSIYCEPLQCKTRNDIGKQVTVWESSKNWTVVASDHHLAMWKGWWKLEGPPMPEIGSPAPQVVSLMMFTLLALMWSRSSWVSFSPTVSLSAAIVNHACEFALLLCGVLYDPPGCISLQSLWDSWPVLVPDTCLDHWAPYLIKMYFKS